MLVQLSLFAWDVEFDCGYIEMMTKVMSSHVCFAQIWIYSHLNCYIQFSTRDKVFFFFFLSSKEMNPILQIQLVTCFKNTYSRDSKMLTVGVHIFQICHTLFESLTNNSSSNFMSQWCFYWFSLHGDWSVGLQVVLVGVCIGICNTNNDRGWGYH